MIIIWIVSLFALFAYGLICYAVGHMNAWNKWEDWTKDERLSQKTRAKIWGHEAEA